MLANSLTIIIVLAIIVEVVTNGIKAVFPKLKGKSSQLVAAIIGIFICFSAKIGILTNLNIEINILYLDYFITGIVISRGSNAVHDIISIFDKQKIYIN